MFLPTNGDIRAAIKSLQAEDPTGVTKYAVAFWGSSAEYNLTGRSLVICDLFSGACNPATIRALNQRPSCVALRLDGLHAKVVANNEGAIVSSANMSTNGLGVEGADSVGTLEAGYRVGKSVELQRIHSWFDELWMKALPISDEDYARAEKIYQAKNSHVLPDFSGDLPSSPTPRTVKIAAEQLLKETVDGENRVRAVTDHVLKVAEMTHPDLDRRMLGKVATFACHAVLCRGGTQLAYERSGDDPGGVVTEAWISSRFRLTGKETRSRVEALLTTFAKQPEIAPSVRHLAAEVLANPAWKHL